MYTVKYDLLKKKGALFLLTLGLSLGFLSGCENNRDQNIDVIPTVTAVPFTATPTATPTNSPTPTPKPWESYEKVGDKGVYLVPAKEINKDIWIGRSCCGGDYVLLYLLNKVSPDDTDYGTLILLRPELSGEAVSFKPDYYMRSCYVIADGTVFIEEGNASLHVFDSSFNEIKSIPSEEGYTEIVLSVTEDGHIWRSDTEKGRLSVCDRYGENTVVFKLTDDRYAYQDLGEKNNKRYFLAASPTIEPYEVVACVDKTTGEVTIIEEKTVSVITGDVLSYCNVSGNLIRDYSNETWYLHFMGENGRRIAFPCYFKNESIDVVSGDRLCISGQLPGVKSPDDIWKIYKGCSVYDVKEKTLLGRLSSLEIEPYNGIYAFGSQENGMVYLIGERVDENGNSIGALLLWDLNEQEPAPIDGFLEYNEDDIAECLPKITEEYRGTYGISYTQSEMKSISCNNNLEAMRTIDLLNMLARGIENNPEEFTKDEEGIAIRLENIHGHERGHSEFNPYVFSEMSKDYYEEEQIRDFYKLVDALRAGEEYYDSQKRFYYNNSVARFATWYYPVTSGCIETSYDYRIKDQWKKGKGKIYYTVPINEATEMMQKFEQLTKDALDDCISDDYTDFEKALALYEYITSYWAYDYDLYYHINDPEWSSVGSLYRCFKDRTGICWEIAGLYEYLLLQCGVNAEDVNGLNTDSKEMHAWSFVSLDGQLYHVDPTWGLAYGVRPTLKYFCFTDEKRTERDIFDPESCFVIGIGDMDNISHGIKAEDDRYASLWDGNYIGMDRAAKKIIYTDQDGMLKSFAYGDLEKKSE